ncbi:MAG: hypothetical protein IPI37_04730 [Bacteroidales bacterium]|nr:hypothetical protein [Bacteroidales bacterium]
MQKDPEPSKTPTLGREGRDGLYDLMKYVYLWASNMPTSRHLTTSARSNSWKP